MKDQEGNSIEMDKIPNEHLLVWGQSGQGKTFFTCRKIEEAVSERKRVLILDFSGSYSQIELEKNKVALGEHLEIRDVSKRVLKWMVLCQDQETFISLLAGAFAECLNISSFYQRKWLKKALAYHFKRYPFFSVPSFMDSLEELADACEGETNSVRDQENLAHLLSRLVQYENLQNFQIAYAGKGEPDVQRKQATVLQISGFVDRERRFLAAMMLHLLWAEARMYTERKRFDLLILDEIQFLSLKRDSPFSCMLREGRKYGIALVMATQFLSAYEKEELETLMQAGHFLIFKPSASDIRFSAKMIAQERSADWKRILERLQIGWAVLVGPYHLNGRKSIARTPVVCAITNQTDSENDYKAGSHLG